MESFADKGCFVFLCRLESAGKLVSSALGKGGGVKMQT